MQKPQRAAKTGLRPNSFIFIAIWILTTLFASQAQGANMEKEQTIYLAGGCFWGVQEYFSRLPGVLATQTGYANSITEKPDYGQVCSGKTNAAEAVRIDFNPAKISLATILKYFFTIIDPLSLNRQGNDIGTQYRTGIYYADPTQLPVINEVCALEQGKYGQPLAVEILPLKNFWPAENYHQDYLKKNPAGYCHINLNAKPDATLTEAEQARYSLPPESELMASLTPQQYAVTRKAFTEPAFSGEYWNNHRPGIYVDVATGQPLFSSSDKFDSGTGWPSFTKPIISGAISGHLDNSHGMKRIEARSSAGHSHLGHIFPDGPASAGGLRYCINSAALRFIPYEEMEKAGYGHLKKLVHN